MGFVADHQGTVVTSHETVDGLARLVLHAAGGHTCMVAADAVTPLPDLDLALVHTEGLGLGVEPLPVTARDCVEVGTYVRIAAGGWREARVLGSSPVTYTATDRFHLLDAAVELAIGTAGSDALRLGGGAAGGPVLDPATGTVIAVLGTALQSDHRVAGFAVPLRTDVRTNVRTDTDGPLAELLARNAATVPAYGADLNLAGVLELTATSVGPDGPRKAAGPGERAHPVEGAELVERAHLVSELASFTADPDAAVLGLVGAPGSGRTTELAALAARRDRACEPAPTLWLRGADLRGADTSVADAARRALERAGRVVAASGEPGERGEPAGEGAAKRCAGTGGALDGIGEGGELGDISPERLALLARDAGRPLLLLLDAPEEMPPDLAHRLPEWTSATADWLRRTGARLVIACRPEYWEQAGAEFPPGLLYGTDEPTGGGGRLPACVWVGDLEEDEAERARERYGIPEGLLEEADARHPLVLRLASEVVRAAPTETPVGRLGRDDVFAAYLDLMCLRVAERLAAVNGMRGRAVRRLAARVSGQVHEAARRCLGSGQGELARVAFESVFPWRSGPERRPGGCRGWASAVLAEGLLVPAGNGYRFAHEELADWIQGMHLDLDTALDALVHPRGELPEQDDVPLPSWAETSVTPSPAPPPLPVPRHRVGPVLQALLLLPRPAPRPELGHARLAARLQELVQALDELRPAQTAASTSASVSVSAPASVSDLASAPGPAWWAARLLHDVLLQVPDASPYVGVLRHLAGRIVTWRKQGRGVPGEFGPQFWTALPLPEATRFDLLRRLVGADVAPPGSGPRYLDAVSDLLAADPTAVQPHLTHWFDDDRPLPATPDATVAAAAQALLHTHRHQALDDLAEALADSAHPRGDELLAVLAEEEPSAVCRAVDRWAHDERPARRAVALTYGLRAAPHVRTEAERDLLRYTALALLARPADRTLHGGALALLVQDPRTRVRYLMRALERFAAGDPWVPASALVDALDTHPGPVLSAFRDRLREPDAGDALRTLAEITTPALARRVAALVRDAVEAHPEAAQHVAAYVDRRLEDGPAARAVLHRLVTGLLDGRSPQARAALAEVLAAPGTPASRPLRREFLDLLLTREHDPVVLDALVRAAADGAARSDEEHTRALVHRAGFLLVRTPDGAARFDRALVDLGRRIPGFATLVARWLTGEPEDWSTVVGPSTRRMIENLAGTRVPA
nr:serine protease [Streptomyces montanus]